MDAPSIIAIPLALSAAVLAVFVVGILCAVGFVIAGLPGMYRTGTRAVSDTWKRWRLRAWWNRANRCRHRRHARDLNGLRCSADIRQDCGFVDSQTIAELRRRAGA